jgi:hypothetical protein
LVVGVGLREHNFCKRKTLVSMEIGNSSPEKWEKERGREKGRCHDDKLLGKSLLHPLTYDGWNTSPPTYENGFFTP